jgi:hypothetical protein
MVTTDPQLNQRRIWWERLIWILDMLAYLFLGGSGVAAMFHVSDYVKDTLLGQSAVILILAILLSIGGIAFVGRLTRVWAIEYAANVFTMGGAFMYAVVLFPSLLAGSSFAVFGATVVSFLYVLRRFAELKIFTSEPADTPRGRLREALRRRTKNTVPRHHY